MESSRPKERKITIEHIAPRNGDKHAKNEQQLDRINNKVQDGVENTHKTPMEDIIKEADKLVAQGQFHKVYHYLKASLKNYDDVELLWRFAQACYLCGNVLVLCHLYYVTNKPCKAFCETYFSEGMNAAKKAMEKNPNHANSLTALKHMLKCEELAPMRSVITLAHLAKCYARLGEKDKAKDYALKVLNYPAHHVEADEVSI
ncbi:unnamed protein product [Schistosoma margrebowiei]|uniref:Uncharacterized protein n=1 Tax=Schistosoma margrebowiei TaxID=48269 RepID=A0A183LTR5_9TREM|nr:unnamed protein product [Schistosoma margrebowiei]